jgi:hypothetical protein
MVLEDSSCKITYLKFLSSVFEVIIVTYLIQPFINHVCDCPEIHGFEVEEKKLPYTVLSVDNETHMINYAISLSSQPISSAKIIHQNSFIS